MNIPPAKDLIRFLLQLIFWALIGGVSYFLGSSAFETSGSTALAFGWGIGGVLLFGEQCWNQAKEGA